MPNIPPLITHMSDARPLYASVPYSSIEDLDPAISVILTPTSTPMMTLNPAGFTWMPGVNLVTIQLSCQVTTAVVNTTDMIQPALGGAGGIALIGSLTPLWTLSSGAGLTLSGIYNIVDDPPTLAITFFIPTTLVSTYTITLQSIQTVFLG